MLGDRGGPRCQMQAPSKWASIWLGKHAMGLWYDSRFGREMPRFQFPERPLLVLSRPKGGVPGAREPSILAISLTIFPGCKHPKPLCSLNPLAHTSFQEGLGQHPGADGHISPLSPALPKVGALGQPYDGSPNLPPIAIQAMLNMTPVGLEPTQLALVEHESTPSDHSGKAPLTCALSC